MIAAVGAGSPLARDCDPRKIGDPAF